MSYLFFFIIIVLNGVCWLDDFNGCDLLLNKGMKDRIGFCFNSY